MDNLGISVFLIYVGIPVCVAVATMLWSWLPTNRVRARRQLKALECWTREYRGKVQPLQRRAEGYFAVRDWLGVEAAYMEARHIVDGKETR